MEESLLHTDLACERLRADTALKGVEYREEERGPARIEHLRIRDEEAAASVGRPIGQYVTMSFAPLYTTDEGTLGELARILSSLIGEFCERLAPGVRSVLTVGLGNRYLTADAVGPESIRAMFATRHLAKEEPELFSRFAEVELSLLAPGVMAQTGIESERLVAGAAEAVTPGLVIAIDALAARATERLGATVQLSDTGIRPGSGIGNGRSAIDKEALGVPVLAIGIPTVVDTATLLYDAFQRAGLSDGQLPESLREVLTEGRSFFVAPREADTVTERAAKLVADAVNLTFSHGFFEEEKG